VPEPYHRIVAVPLVIPRLTSNGETVTEVMVKAGTCDDVMRNEVGGPLKVPLAGVTKSSSHGTIEPPASTTFAELAPQSIENVQ